VYFLAYEELLELSEPEATPSPAELVSIITCMLFCALSSVENNISMPRQAELISLHRGQGLELLWRDSLECPSEEQYVDMVNNSGSPEVRMGVTV
jgi:geranylgeranyl diphosphate synthase type 3